MALFRVTAGPDGERKYFAHNSAMASVQDEQMKARGEVVIYAEELGPSDGVFAILDGLKRTKR